MKNGQDMKKTSDIQISIILPTYNEKDNIILLIKEINKNLVSGKINYECVIMDDDSPDGTYENILKYFKDDAQIRPFLRKKDHGLAKSIIDGIKKARGKAILVMDSDFNHDPKMICQMHDVLKYYDMVIGSRFVYNGGMEDVLRNKFSYFYNQFVRLILGTHINDNLSGYFIMKADLLRAITDESIFQGYGEYFIRLIYRAKLNNYNILEVPVYYNLRRHGNSKSNFLKMIASYSAAVFLELLGEIRRTKSLRAIFNR